MAKIGGESQNGYATNLNALAISSLHKKAQLSRRNVTSMNIEHALVAEDDAVQRIYLKRVLRQIGITHVADAADGLAAIEALSRQQWDLVVSDLDMPGATGLQIIDALANAGSNTRLIIVSSHDQRILAAAEAYALGKGVRILAAISKASALTWLTELIVTSAAIPSTSTSRTAPVITFRPTSEEISRALDHGEIAAHFQLRHRVSTGELWGAELLSRWDHPRHGALDPDQFLPIASTGLANELSEYMIAEAIGMLSKLGAGNTLRLSANVSAQVATSATWAEHVARRCLSAHVQSSALIIEITENGPGSSSAGLAGAIAQLRIRGTDCTIGNFGCGCASLEHLSAAPFSHIKIERSLIARARTAPHAQMLLGTAVAMGHNLGMIVIADGVETAGDLALVRALGIDIAQGNYYGMAMPGHEFFNYATGFKK